MARIFIKGTEAIAEAAAVTASLLPQVESHTELPLIPITPRMSVPAAGLDE